MKKALIFVTVVGCLSQVLWAMLLHDTTRHQQTANRLAAVKLKAEQVAHAQEVDAVLIEMADVSAELVDTQLRLVGARKALTVAEQAALPCPGSCGIPDCRKVIVMLGMLDACLAYHDQMKANLLGR